MAEILDWTTLNLRDNCQATRIVIKNHCGYDGRHQIVFFGCDPGTVNLGLAFMYWNRVELFQLKIMRSDDALERMRLVQSILPQLFNYTTPILIGAIIEGSSFADRYRQVELAEQRAAIALWVDRLCRHTKIMPPISVRKNAFGSGKTKAWEVYPDIPKDAAVALSCVIVAKKMFENKVYS